MNIFDKIQLDVWLVKQASAFFCCDTSTARFSIAEMQRNTKINLTKLSNNLPRKESLGSFLEFIKTIHARLF